MGLGKLVKKTAGIAGAGVGFAVGGPAGAMIGAGLGQGLSSMFGDDPYRAPSFADIDLKSANPQLWEQLQRMNASVTEAERLYNDRQKGPTEQELSQVAASKIGLDEQLASRGLLGTSAGMSSSVSAQNDMNASLNERVRQEQMQLFNNLASQRAGYAQAFSSAQGQVMSPLMQQSQMNFQQQADQSQAQNQFASGLFNAGMTMYGNQQNMDAMNTQRDADRNMYKSIYSGGPSQSQGYAFNSAPSGGYSMGVPSFKQTYGGY